MKDNLQSHDFDLTFELKRYGLDTDLKSSMHKVCNQRLVSKGIRIGDRWTTIRFPPAARASIDKICENEKITKERLFLFINEFKSPDLNLSSAIRLFTLDYLNRRNSALEAIIRDVGEKACSALSKSDDGDKK